MPRIVDYPDVLAQAGRQGLRSLYHNSGAFGFAAGTSSLVRGWIGSPDPSIRPAALVHARPVAAPIETSLARLTVHAWTQYFPGPAWLLPRSHWAYELDFGNRSWLPEALEKIGMGSAADTLIQCNNGAAIEFDLTESELLFTLLEAMVTSLFGSDFGLIFPDRPILATVHHHKQIWWETTDGDLLIHLDRLLATSSNPP